MGRRGSGRNAKAVMRLATERKPRMRLALGDGRQDPSPEPWPRKVNMRLAQTSGCTPTERSDADGTHGSEQHFKTSTERQLAKGIERTVASRTCSVGCQTVDSPYSVGCQAAPTAPHSRGLRDQESSAHQEDAALAAAIAALDEFLAQSAAREAELRAELAAAREQAERAAAEGEHFLQLHKETPSFQVDPAVDSQKRPDADALMAAVCTPSQSPERSNAEITPAPSSPGRAITKEFDITRPQEHATEATCSQQDTDAACGTPARQECDDTHGDPTATAVAEHVCRSCSEVLFIDNVCYWVAAFSPKAWAPVCAKSARFVLGTMNTSLMRWNQIVWDLGQMQSMGQAHPSDLQYLGPEAGWIYWHYHELYSLKNTLWTLAHAGPVPGPAFVRWFNRWLLYLDFVMNAYDELRIKHKELYIYADTVLQDHKEVISTLHDVLEQHDANNAAAVDAEGENV